MLKKSKTTTIQTEKKVQDNQTRQPIRKETEREEAKQPQSKYYENE